MIRPRALRLALLTSGLLALVLAPTAPAQDPPSLRRLFPLKVGRQWTYSMKVTLGGQTRTIEYTTKVARVEDVPGLGPCAVFESRSNKRLMQVEWYRDDGTKLENPRRQEGAGAPVESFTGRVLLTAQALATLDGPAHGPAPSWAWSSSDGSAKGTVTLERREELHLQLIGSQDCVVLVDRGTFRVGDAVRLQERRLWLAPDLGLVKEAMTVKKKDGEVTIRTEAVLRRYETP